MKKPSTIVMLMVWSAWALNAAAQDEASTVPDEPRLQTDSTVAEPIPAVQQDDHSVRPSFYINLLVFGASLVEDQDNRLTVNAQKELKGIGGILRAGAVIRGNHLIGGRLHSFVRPTRKVIGLEDEWGVVMHHFAGAEYRYITDFGLYFGGSLGISLTMAGDEHHDRGCCRDNLDDLRCAVGFGVIGTVGYELRLSRWFAMGVELFAGSARGLDENETDMNNHIGGFALGFGF